MQKLHAILTQALTWTALQLKQPLADIVVHSLRQILQPSRWTFPDVVTHIASAGAQEGSCRKPMLSSVNTDSTSTSSN